MTTSEQDLRSSLKTLIGERDAIEMEIQTLSAKLSAPNMPGLIGGLLDSEVRARPGWRGGAACPSSFLPALSPLPSALSEPSAPAASSLVPQGFPRADVDIFQIRTDRHRLAELHTDHKGLTARIEKGMLALHALLREKKDKAAEGGEVPTVPAETSQPGPKAREGAAATVAAAAAAPRPAAPPVAPEAPAAPSHGAPLALIDSVAEGSPASRGGKTMKPLVLACLSIKSFFLTPLRSSVPNPIPLLRKHPSPMVHPQDSTWAT